MKGFFLLFRTDAEGRIGFGAECVGAEAAMETAHFLSAIDPFSQLAQDPLAQLAQSYKSVSLPAGAVIIKQGRPVQQVGIIQSGSAKITVVDHVGDEYVCGRLGPGDLVFDAAVLSGTVASASVIVLSPAICFMQPYNGFIETIEAHPPLKHFFYHNAALGIRWGYEFFSGRHTDAVVVNMRHPAFIRKAIEYIDDNYHHPITLEMVAKATAMSKFHFSRLFKQHMGVSFKRYLNRKRIKAAKQLISQSGYNVTEASFAVGFNDASYFSRVFREEEGSSPKWFLLHH
ncbi:hypothetical protein DSCO28_70660 [Desulfosarcina ovata subsp. sediminis]|uniref:AraC family transcriptional regulator n=1 Tax=Desulfosarcina ovata subsp. sediminis TaxID=885957 RepID=A0A5K8A2J7_9BACT|nr:helix-turn-helix domain-containing protein [Desulfosarcina ovata]BBO86500.1 hypothetical protein DSCO28_70660 [Desulfosarcina ovata subsp. sediminis]